MLYPPNGFSHPAVFKLYILYYNVATPTERLLNLNNQILGYAPEFGRLSNFQHQLTFVVLFLAIQLAVRIVCSLLSLDIPILRSVNRLGGALLGALTGLAQPTRRIEAVDISNTSGSEVVGGIVVFVDGRPSKKDYKRYKIKTVEGQDDYESMREVVWRRMRRFQKGEAGFDTLPDLLLLDGGKGQLSAVREILDELEIDIPVFGMVKDDRHRTRGLVGEQGEITPRPVSPAFVLLAQIQEEVHRYAIAYHRALRGKKTFSSQLSNIPGIGKARAAALLSELKTLDAIRAATPQELAGVPGMNRTAAQAVWRYFHGEELQNMEDVDQTGKSKYNKE